MSGAPEEATTLTTAEATTTEAPTTTQAPTTEAPTTETPTTEPLTTELAATDFTGPLVSPSVAAFLSDRAFLNQLLTDGDPNIELLTIEESMFETEPLGDGRLAVGAFATEAGFMGFVTDEATGAVLNVVLVVDTDGETAAELFLTTFGVAGEVGPTFDTLTEAYAATVSDGVIDNPRYVVSGTNDFVIRLAEGAQSDDELVVVVISPATDEATALAQYRDIEVDALSSLA